MKKLFAVLLSVLVLGLGVSFAQTDADVSEEGVSVEISPEEGVDFDTTQYVGGSLGYELSVFYGRENFFADGVDLRGRLSSYYFANTSLGADVLVDIAQLEENIQLYAGGGLGLNTYFGDGLALTLGVLGGGEYRFNQELGVFVEGGAGYAFGNLSTLFNNFAPRLSVGANYHF